MQSRGQGTDHPDAHGTWPLFSSAPERALVPMMEEPWSFTMDPKRSQKRTRFNLLTLEHGEYYFQVKKGERARVVSFLAEVLHYGTVL